MARRSKEKVRVTAKGLEKNGSGLPQQQEQNQELTALLEECKKEAEELANLVRNKDEVILKNLKRHLLNAKKVIAELQAEV